ncbi:MAG: hypothetical protein KME27_17160 [Lyngbya sp. HA4199-MV5]|nr:hypothetical protein [Lyngbya sp. HA4199-MV5]
MRWTQRPQALYNGDVRQTPYTIAELDAIAAFVPCKVNLVREWLRS